MSVLIQRGKAERSVSSETPVEIYLNGQSMAVSQSTPKDLSELAVGLLLSEGLISDRTKLREVKEDSSSSQVQVFSDEKLHKRRSVMYRFTGSGCPDSHALKSAHNDLPVIASKAQFEAEDMLAMMNELCQLSPLRNDGECVHGCGIGYAGSLELVREDVGRHNAMDKLIGQAWLDGIPFVDRALFTTGRISFEMACKAIQAGVSVLVSHKSATDAGVKIAENCGLTLIEKCRDNSLHVLTHYDRIV